MTRIICYSQKLIYFVFVLIFLIGTACNKDQKDQTAKLTLDNQSNHSARFDAVRSQDKPAPVYIKLEIEDFEGIDSENNSTSGWRQSMSWHPQWSRGGASGWWGARGLANASAGTVSQKIYIPQDGEYSLWMRYQDYFNKTEPFTVIINYAEGVAKAEFGVTDVAKQNDPKIKWSYVWDKKTFQLKKGKAKISIQLEKTSENARDTDALVLTNDFDWIPQARGFPPQAYSKYLLKWAENRKPLQPLVKADNNFLSIHKDWELPQTAGRDFWYLGASEIISDFPIPVNIRPEIDNPSNAKAFAARYADNPQSAPIFGNPLTAIQIPISQVGELLKTENSLRQYILTEKRPFVFVGNYNSAGKIPGSYQQLEQIFGNLWVGIVSGENSYLRIPLYPDNISADTDFKNANYQWLFNDAKDKLQQTINTDWASIVPNPFDKMILAQSVGSIPHVHQLAEAGVGIPAAESAGAMPYIQAQTAFVRGTARQYGKPWLWYFGASFGSSIRTFTKEPAYIIDLEDMKIDSRNAIVGPSLAHIRRALLFSYLQGASYVFPEQGYNLFDTNGELNPMGWAYDETLQFAAKHPNRGVINTPVAILMDKTHGWDKYGYNGMRIWDKKSLERSDKMINSFLNVAYFPFPKNEGDFANDLNVPYPNGYFGDIFDVIVTSPTKTNSIQNYPVVFCVGDTKLGAKWADLLKKYVAAGGTLVINTEQLVPELDESFLGVKLKENHKEANEVICERDNEILNGTTFPYQEVVAGNARTVARASNGDPIALVNNVGKGQVILTTPSYLMGYDQEAMPYMAHLLLEITSGLQPLEVRGNCQYFINLRKDGYVVTLSNNEGLVKLSDSPAETDMSKNSTVVLNIKDKPLATEDWIGQQNITRSFPNEWLPQYTQPKQLVWKQEGDIFKTTVNLLPGEIRVYFIRLKESGVQ